MVVGFCFGVCLCCGSLCLFLLFFCFMLCVVGCCGCDECCGFLVLICGCVSFCCSFCFGVGLVFFVVCLLFVWVWFAFEFEFILWFLVWFGCLG